MYVPPYVPQPIEIDGNVAQEPYQIRLGFVRRVALAHFFTVLLIAGLACLPALPEYEPLTAGLGVVTLLVLLSLVRALAKGRDADQRLSTVILPFLIAALAIWARGLERAGWEVWVVGIAALCSTAYAGLCGRDLSFVGMFVIPSTVTTAISLGIGLAFDRPLVAVAWALVLAFVFLFYTVYDLAALLTRRRLGEEWGAVADLYRDVLNGISYPIRVIQHWRDHRIWTPPKEWFR